MAAPTSLPTPSATAAWPLSRERHELLATLGEMIRRFGPERFVEARLVAASARDFPERWEPTLAALHAVLYRMCWLVHIDPEIVVVDERAPAPAESQMLTVSSIELGTTTAGVATFHVAAIGNDDVAGLLAHKLGQAFLELAPGDPFRTASREADDREGSVAAVFLGLGVLVANSSMYRRHAVRMVGRDEVSEQYIATTGGLSLEDATLLLAIQDLVRDDHQDALETLQPSQREWVDHWRDVLEPHEDELRVLLGLDLEHERRPLQRSASPRVPATVAEPDLRRFNRGRVTFRTRDRRWTPAILCGGLGAFGFLAPYGAVVGSAAVLVGLVIGAWFSRPYYVCTDPDCMRHMPAELPTCPGCGGAIVETLAHARDRLDRLEELQAAGAIDRDVLDAEALAESNDELTVSTRARTSVRA